MKKSIVMLAMLFAFSTAFTSCRNEEKKTDDMEEAADDTGDAIEDAAEDTGDAVEDAAEDVGDAAEEGADEVEENTGMGGNDDL
ncbi:hypothetical protein [Mesonia aquimarina]|uniref:hypothetical protein n=1 Tax=Mesonia aquimarina TaxID=1504967 RepID=UPI000EF5DC5C|nr:hypothetical protein [Mesonia aquimarina]